MGASAIPADAFGPISDCGGLTTLIQTWDQGQNQYISFEEICDPLFVLCKLPAELNYFVANNVHEKQVLLVPQ